MDSEKTLNRTDKNGVWDVLGILGVRGLKLTEVIKILYRKNRAGVRSSRGVS